MMPRRYIKLAPSEAKKRFCAAEFAPIVADVMCIRCGGTGVVQTANGPDACLACARWAEMEYQGNKKNG